MQKRGDHSSWMPAGGTTRLCKKMSMWNFWANGIPGSFKKMAGAEHDAEVAESLGGSRAMLKQPPWPDRSRESSASYCQTSSTVALNLKVRGRHQKEAGIFFPPLC